MSLKDLIISLYNLFNNGSDNPKIVGISIGREIERIFIEPRRDILNNGGSIIITIDEIKREIPRYSAGNGHSALRGMERGGKQIGYLNYYYDVQKFYKIPNDTNSALIEIVIRNKPLI